MGWQQDLKDEFPEIEDIDEVRRVVGVEEEKEEGIKILIKRRLVEGGRSEYKIKELA